MDGVGVNLAQPHLPHPVVRSVPHGSWSIESWQQVQTTTHHWHVQANLGQRPILPGRWTRLHGCPHRRQSLPTQLMLSRAEPCPLTFSLTARHSGSFSWSNRRGWSAIGFEVGLSELRERLGKVVLVQEQDATRTD